MSMNKIRTYLYAVRKDGFFLFKKFSSVLFVDFADKTIPMDCFDFEASN